MNDVFYYKYGKSHISVHDKSFCVRLSQRTFDFTFQAYGNINFYMQILIESHIGKIPLLVMLTKFYVQAYN